MRIKALTDVFEKASERKITVQHRIKAIEDISKILHGEDRRFVRNELAPLKDEYEWLCRLQKDVLQEIKNEHLELMGALGCLSLAEEEKK